MESDINSLTLLLDNRDISGHSRDMSHRLGHGTSGGTRRGITPVGGNAGCPARAEGLSHPSDCKFCSSCGVEKPRSNYFPSKATTDGLHTSCMPCGKAAWKALLPSGIATGVGDQFAKAVKRRRSDDRDSGDFGMTGFVYPIFQPSSATPLAEAFRHHRCRTSEPWRERVGCSLIALAAHGRAQLPTPGLFNCNK